MKDPSRHIAMVTARRVSTLIVSKQPLSDRDIARLKRVTSDLEFRLVIIPGSKPKNDVLAAIVSADSPAVLRARVADEPLNYEPPTDDNPYFFNMLRLSHLGSAFGSNPGVIRGNLIATLTLVVLILSLLVVAIATVVIPLLAGGRSRGPTKRPSRIFWSGALYFSAIGAGFMFVEIGLIQRLSVFLGHPIYALGVILFTLILSTGIGSVLSDHLPLTRTPWLFVFPSLTVLLILTTPWLLSIVISNMITSDVPEKILVSVALLFPMGVLMGFFFPTGMRLVRSVVASETPWYWALNGIFGVLCSAMAVFISIYFGIATNFYIAAACYSLLLLSIYNINDEARKRGPATAVT